MSATLRKRKGNPAGPPAPSKRPAAAVTHCPNCHRLVGNTDFILCTKCDAKVHLLCTQITTDDALNKTANFANFLCHICCPPSVEDESDAAMEGDTETDVDASTITQPVELLMTILKEVQALRRSNRKLERHSAMLERQVSVLTARVEELSVVGAQQNAQSRYFASQHVCAQEITAAAFHQLSPFWLPPFVYNWHGKAASGRPFET